MQVVESRNAAPADVSSDATSPGTPAGLVRRDGATAVVAAWAFAATAAAITLWPLIIKFAHRVRSAEHYHAFPLVLIGCAYFGWRRFRELPFDGPARPRVRLTLWGIAVSVTSVAVLAGSPWAAATAVVMLLFAASVEWKGRAAVRGLLSVFGVVAVAMPLPGRYDFQLISGLQHFIARWASFVLDLAGVRHLPVGTTILMPGRQYFVEEACSGINSLFTSLGAVALYALATRRGPVRTTFLLAAAVFWVIVANVGRVLLIVVLPSRYGLPVTEGIAHDVIGVGVFVVALLLIASTDRLLLFIMPERLPDRAGFGVEDAVGPVERWRDESSAPVHPTGRSARPVWLRAALPAALIVLFGGLASSAGGLRALSSPAIDGPAEGTIKAVPESHLPAVWQGWGRVGFETKERESGALEGRHSRIWFYRKGRMTAAVSIDGPFYQWHDLLVCYRGNGWEADSIDDAPNPDGAADAGEHTEMVLSKPTGRFGLVLFAAYMQEDVPVSGLKVIRSPMLKHSFRLLDRIDRMLGQEHRDEPTTIPGVADRVYQVQLFAESGVDFTAAERNDLRDLFHEMRRRIAGFGRDDAEGGRDGASTNQGVRDFGRGT